MYAPLVVNPLRQGRAGQFERERMLEVGTKIRFLHTLTEVANDEHPDIQYATKGETGEITKVGGCREGYWVKTDSWPNAFGCESKDFEVLTG